MGLTDYYITFERTQEREEIGTMKKCCFIIPYFGKFNNYFQLFLKTCAFNHEFTWLVFTDDMTPYIYPDNVIRHKMNFEQLRELVQNKFDFHIELNNPYKLCDFKPAYGFIFEEYIKEFEYWGHCDTDVIMGDLSKFLTDQLLSEFDKLFGLGHMTIYKNTHENNRVFMKPYCGEYLYRKVFSNPQICWFDEEWKDDNNVNQIFIHEGKRVFQKDLSANFNIWKNSFQRKIYVGHEASDTHGYFDEPLIANSLYYWKNGACKRKYILNGELKTDEFLYIHLQSRRMYFDKSILKMNQFKILPNKFLKLEGNPDNYEDFVMIKKKCICFHEFQLKYKRCKRNWTRRVKKICSLIVGR